MFTERLPYSTVTAILPSGRSGHVAESLMDDDGGSVLLWRARGTQLTDRWWQRWVPPISPAKSMLHMLVPDSEVDRVVGTIIERGRLCQQAVGAVYSNRCDHVYLGSTYQAWPARSRDSGAAASGRLKDDLSVIFCIVGHDRSNRVARAAIRAGAHGPIVYYSEGRGLRDRLGWLRITKEHEQEVLMVMADEAQVEEIFDAMAKAGEFHLPGRGLMYRLCVDKGMFNLPSRVAHHHYAASMQQIIHAIDSLQGHTHWRDQAVFDVGVEGRMTGLDFVPADNPALTDQACLSAILRRDDSQPLMDLMLDAGAPGLTMHHARYAASGQQSQIAGACITDEHTMFRCVVDQHTAARVCEALEQNAEGAGITDLCVTVSPVPRVARYVPGAKDYRRPSADDAGGTREAAYG